VYTLYFPIGTTGLIDMETYETSPYYNIPIDDETRVDNAYLDECFKLSAEVTHESKGSSTEDKEPLSNHPSSHNVWSY